MTDGSIPDHCFCPTCKSPLDPDDATALLHDEVLRCGAYLIQLEVEQRAHPTSESIAERLGRERDRYHRLVALYMRSLAPLRFAAQTAHYLERETDEARVRAGLSPTLAGVMPKGEGERKLDEVLDENRRLRQAIVALGAASGTQVMTLEVVDTVAGRGTLLLCFPQGNEESAVRMIAGILAEAGTKGVGEPKLLDV